MTANEIPVQDGDLVLSARTVVRFDQHLQESFEDRDVSANTDLMKPRTDGGRGQCRHLDRVLRRLEALKRPLAKGVEGDDGGAAPRRVAQARHHAGTVGARVLPEDEDTVRLVEIIQQDGALANAERKRQTDACRLVTHIRAIRKVVGAVLPREELVEEGRFVRGAAGRVKLRHVRVR